MAVACLLPVALDHPYQMSYFSSLVGGRKGALACGIASTANDKECLNRVTLAYLNKQLPPKSKVLCYPFGPDAMQVYQKIGMLRSDIVIDGAMFKAYRFPYDWVSSQDYLLLTAWNGGFDDIAWQLYFWGKPMFQVTKGGVPLVMLYDTRDSRNAAIIKELEFHVMRDYDWAD